MAVTPGVDFEEEGSGVGERRVRLSFPGTTEHVAEAMRRLVEWWESEAGLRWRGGAEARARIETAGRNKFASSLELHAIMRASTFSLSKCGPLSVAL